MDSQNRYGVPHINYTSYIMYICIYVMLLDFCGMQGELKLINTEDHCEHIFKLIGIAERPLAQDRIKIFAQVKQRLI